jgi:hypothetical protein
VTLDTREHIQSQDFDVFISYRRQEASYVAALLYDALSGHFGQKRIFLDIDNIRPGSDFLESIRLALESCHVLLVIIGPTWLENDEYGRRRIDDPADPVRFEIETALRRGTRVLPVLLDGANMPNPDSLPVALVQLSFRNAINVRRGSLRSDVTRVVAELNAMMHDRQSDAYSVDPEVLEEIPERLAPVSPLRTSWLAQMDRSEPARQRARFLTQLSRTYKNYIDQVLGEAVLLRLTIGLELMPSKTVRISDQLLPFGDPPNSILPEDTELLNVFDNHAQDGSGFLLLGEPGSGKTAALFELALQLTKRAQGNRRHPMPVYLTLSSWRSGRPLINWLVDQLDSIYQVPPKLSWSWIRSGHLFFLLDGLDEVPGYRTRLNCAEEINRFTRFGREVLLPTVVSSRLAEYTALGIRLHLDTAVALRSLEPATVVRHLAEAGPPTDSIVGIVRADAELQDLLRTPLLLSMFTLTYAGSPNLVISSTMEGRDEFRAQLISRYVEHRLSLERQGSYGRNRYPAAATKRWLKELAQALRRGEDSILFLEQLPVAWVSRRRAVRLMIAVPLLIWGVTAGLSFSLTTIIARRLGLSGEADPLGTLVAFIAFGVTAGLIGHLSILRRVCWWLIFGLLLTGVSMVAAGPSMQMGPIIALALFYIFFFGFLGEIAVQSLSRRLPLVEHLSWSWRPARRVIARQFSVGVAFGLAFDVPNWLISGLPPGEALFLGIVFGLVFGAFFGLTLGLGAGLRSGPIPMRRRPNEGVRKSTVNGAAVALVGTFIAALIFFGSGLFLDVTHGIIRAVALGPATGVLWGLTAGLGAVLQYWIFRVLIWWYGLAPIRYGSWLAYVANLRILYWGIGGGYLFIHRVVQDFFAQEDLGVHPRNSDDSS